MLTAHKVSDLVKHQGRQKRTGDVAAAAFDLEQIISSEPTPEFAAQMAEEFQILLDRLNDDELRQAALWKMEGYTNEEIAGKLDCVVRSVERKLWTIRKIWRKEGDAGIQHRSGIPGNRMGMQLESRPLIWRKLRQDIS